MFMAGTAILIATDFRGEYCRRRYAISRLFLRLSPDYQAAFQRHYADETFSSIIRCATPPLFSIPTAAAFARRRHFAVD